MASDDSLPGACPSSDPPWQAALLEIAEQDDARVRLAILIESILFFGSDASHVDYWRAHGTTNFSDHQVPRRDDCEPFVADLDQIVPLLRRMQKVLWDHGHLEHALKFHDYIAWFERRPK